MGTYNRGKNKGIFISTKDIIIFENDIMIFDSGKNKDTLILKYEYFSTMKVMDPKTKKTGKYTMKGANWTDYLFK